MKKLYVAFFITAFITSTVAAQYSKHIVQLKDKKGTLYTLANPSAYLSPKAIERRNRQKIAIDSTDLPLSQAYLDSIASVANVTIYNKSKWLNQVLINTTDPAALTKINNFSFVKSTTPIAARIAQSDNSSAVLKTKFEETEYRATNINRSSNVSGTGSIDYGGAYQQVHIHQGEYLHEKGFTGNGITIAMLDGGFNSYRTNPALDSLRLQNRVLGEWDFVDRQTDVNGDDAHGMFCLSVIASNSPGKIVGSAPKAKFWLLRTEDVHSEYPVEEQNWAAGAEFADSVGADIISSSLGYSDFDDPTFNHSYAQRNGNTAISTIAADYAAKKGMIVTVSAGNSGNVSQESKFVSCPADADSVVTVGATNIYGAIANFSSWGPNSAGKIKPNVVSVGQGTIVAWYNGLPTPLDGTSFAAPNMAGLIACLWQAYPEFTNMEIINTVQKSSDKFNSPDGRYGYGLPNFRKAFDLLEQEKLTRNFTTIIGDSRMKVFPAPFTNTLNVLIKPSSTGTAAIQLYDNNGRLIENISISVTTDQLQLFNFKKTGALPSGVYIVRYSDGHDSETIKVVK